MGLGLRFGRGKAAAPEERAQVLVDSGVAAITEVLTGDVSEGVTMKEALSLPGVWAAINFLSAAMAGLPVTPHAANLGLVTMATMHLLRAIPNAGKYLEFSIEGEDYYPWQRGLFLGDPFRVQDGHLAVTGAPGWGLTVNPDWLAKAEYRDSDRAEQTAYAALYHGTLDAQL